MANEEDFCHCCGIHKGLADDFGYNCESCDYKRHCSSCHDKFLYGTCDKCARKMWGCAVCGDKHIEKPHEHHVFWKRFGGEEDGWTIRLCAKHHHGLHQYTENKAILSCLEKNSYFFEDMLRQYMDEKSE